MSELQKTVNFTMNAHNLRIFNSAHYL